MKHLFAKIPVIFLLAAMATIGLAQRDGPPSTADVHGQVRFAAGSAPAERVMVLLESYGGGMAGQVLTDRNGTFQFRGLQKTQYTIIVRAAGYREAQQQVNLQVVSSEYVQLQLTADPNARKESEPAAIAGILDANVPPDAQKEFAAGRKAILEGKKFEEGRKHLEKALSIYPNFLEAQLLLGTAWMESRNWEKAEAALRRALEIKPQTAQAYFALGEVYRQQARHKEAAEILQKGLAIDKHAWQGHYTLARVYLAMNDLARAGEAAGHALQIRPDFAEGYLLAGNLLLRARKAENALPMFEEYLRLAPNGEAARETRELVAKLKKALAEKK